MKGQQTQYSICIRFQTFLSICVGVDLLLVLAAGVLNLSCRISALLIKTMFKARHISLYTEIGEDAPVIQIQAVRNNSLAIGFENVLAGKAEMSLHYDYTMLYRISGHRNWTRVNVTFDDGPREASVAESLQPNTGYQVQLQAYRQHRGHREYTTISQILELKTACGGKEPLCEGKGPLCGDRNQCVWAKNHCVGIGNHCVR